MPHDLDDLLEMIKTLEIRIIELERSIDPNRTVNAPDLWYFEY